MRLVVDLQCLQTESRYRGIGRYAMSLLDALLRLAPELECWIVLNDRDAGAIELVTRRFAGRVSASRIVTLSVPEGINETVPGAEWRVRAMERVHAEFLAALAPDVVLTMSLFEFDAVAAIAPRTERDYAEAVILYDLIPLAEPAAYLGSPLAYRWYDRKLASLRNADVCLAISDHSRADALARVALTPAQCVAISAAADSPDYPEDETAASSAAVDQLLAGGQRFVLYVGGFDSRKNVDRLIAAYSVLPAKLRARHPLVLVGRLVDRTREHLARLAKKHGLEVGRDVRFPGFVPDSRLAALYRACGLFVFPSSNEGFGLPPLEAMRQGAVVIAANRTSLPEVVALPEAMFDPDDGAAFASLMQRALTDAGLRERLVQNAARQAGAFSWARTAGLALHELHRIAAVRETVARPARRVFDIDGLTRRVGELGLAYEPDDEDLFDLAHAISASAGQLAGLREWDRRVAARLGGSFLEPSGFEDLPALDGVAAPFVFTSTLCRAQHFRTPFYAYWCRVLGEQPRFHRKQWEFVFICQALFERGQIAPGKRAIGFGVGREPLVSCFASRGVSVLASDLDLDEARRLGWAATGQHSDGYAGLNDRGLCPPDAFARLVNFRNIDMNRIPDDVGRFDFCWSSCAFEHLGSIRNGLEFVKRSVRLLDPGGVAVHTTEFNLTSNVQTIDDDESFVIFRRRDIEQLASELAAEGCTVEPVDFCAGSDRLERYVDLPPYQDDPHLRLELAGRFVSTSIGLIIRKPL